MYRSKPKQLKLYKRFIDDVIMIWQGEKNELEDLILNLDSNNKNIKLTWNISEEEIQFLDLNIKQEN